MNPADVLDLGRETVIVMIKVAGPVMMVGLVVGIIVSLVQTLTQIQEQTLVFIPKILAIFVALLLFLPLMTAFIEQFWRDIAARIIRIGGAG